MTSPSIPMTVEHINKSYGKQSVLGDISFSLNLLSFAFIRKPLIRFFGFASSCLPPKTNNGVANVAAHDSMNFSLFMFNLKFRFDEIHHSVFCPL